MSTVESNGYTPSTTYGGSTAFNAMKIHTHSDMPTGTKLIACAKNSNASNTNAPQLRASDGTTVLATGSAWSSNSSTFDYTLSANTDYFIGMVGDGSSSSFTWQNVQSFPVNGTYLNWTASMGTFATTYPVTIQSVTLETPVSQTVMASTLTLSTTEKTPTVFASAIVVAPLQSLNLSLEDPRILNPLIADVTVGTGQHDSRFIKTNWPTEEGLDLGTTKTSGRDKYLKPQKSLIRTEYKKGL